MRSEAELVKERAFLEESRTSWEQDAAHERKGLVLSAIIAGAGIVLVGVGIGDLLVGNFGGIIELLGGGALATALGHTALEEVDTYADIRTNVAVKQHQIDEIDKRLT